MKAGYSRNEIDLKKNESKQRYKQAEPFKQEFYSSGELMESSSSQSHLSRIYKFPPKLNLSLESLSNSEASQEDHGRKIGFRKNRFFEIKKKKPRRKKLESTNCSLLQAKIRLSKRPKKKTSLGKQVSNCREVSKGVIAFIIHDESQTENCNYETELDEGKKDLIIPGNFEFFAKNKFRGYS